MVMLSIGLVPAVKSMCITQGPHQQPNHKPTMLLLRVVYGDTDSLFVLLPGRSREEAFRIGTQIAAAVTSANPAPVTLKLEKVYHPCVLLSKKRYVGAMYESPTQQEPSFDAKGIETVRRDTCPAVAKMLERCLRVLFATRDVSQVCGWTACCADMATAMMTPIVLTFVLTSVNRVENPQPLLNPAT